MKDDVRARIAFAANREGHLSRILVDKEIMSLSFTAVFQKVPEGYIGFVEELPGANTQGETLEETRDNLREAVELVLEANRQLAEESINGGDVIREPFLLNAA